MPSPDDFRPSLPGSPFCRSMRDRRPNDEMAARVQAAHDTIAACESALEELLWAEAPRPDADDLTWTDVEWAERLALTARICIQTAGTRLLRAMHNKAAAQPSKTQREAMQKHAEALAETVKRIAQGRTQ